MKVVHWPLMGAWAVTFCTARRDWAGPQPAQANSRCTKCNSPPINDQCTNHRIASPLLCGFNVPIKWVNTVSLLLSVLFYCPTFIQSYSTLIRVFWTWRLC